MNIDEIITPPGFDHKKPVIYEWTVTVGDDEYHYIGLASKGSSRPLKAYSKGVYNFLNNVYRKSYGRNQGKVRPAWRSHIHPIFAKADKIILEMNNIELDELDATESREIQRIVEQYGRDKVLNKMKTKGFKK